MALPTDVCPNPPESMNVTLYNNNNKTFADILKFLWIVQVGPKYHHKGPLRGREGRKRQKVPRRHRDTGKEM